MADCTSCGAELREQARFCPSCGSAAPTAATSVTAVPGAAKSPKARLPPLDPTTPVAPTPAPAGTGDRSTKWLIGVVVASFVVIAGALTMVAFAGGSGGDAENSGDGDASATADTTAANATVPDDAVAAAPEDEPQTTTGASPDSTRSGTLFSNFARLRDAPNLSASEVTTLTSEGARLDVVGENVDGWYLVRINGFEGYLFGTFVRPADPGLSIAQSSGGDAVLLNSSGQPLGISNESGPKVLVVDTSGSLWEVVLPDGGTAYVDPGTVSLVG